MERQQPALIEPYDYEIEPVQSRPSFPTSQPGKPVPIPCEPSELRPFLIGQKDEPNSDDSNSEHASSRAHNSSTHSASMSKDRYTNQNSGMIRNNPIAGAGCLVDTSKLPEEEGNYNEANTISFPMKLHEILSNENFVEYITWMPHGRAFRILSPKGLGSNVLPHYFAHSRYSTFLRCIKSWGFKHITQGRDRNCYYHQAFLRGLPHLCKDMVRPKNQGKLLSDPGNEPDFYRISELHPLPDVSNQETWPYSAITKCQSKPCSSRDIVSEHSDVDHTDSASLHGLKTSFEEVRTSQQDMISIIESELQRRSNQRQFAQDQYLQDLAQQQIAQHYTQQQQMINDQLRYLAQQQQIAQSQQLAYHCNAMASTQQQYSSSNTSERDMSISAVADTLSPNMDVTELITQMHQSHMNVATSPNSIFHPLHFLGQNFHY